MLRAWVCLVVLLTAIYVGTASPDYYPGDDRYYLNLAGQLVEKHTIALKLAGKPDPDSAFVGADGQTYAKYTLGHPLLLAVAYALVRPLAGWLTDAEYTLAQRLAFALVPALALAVTLALLAARGRALGYAPRICVAWALAMGLATGLWPASKALLTEPTQALVLALIFLGARHALETPSVAGALALGLAAAYALHVKLTLALAVAVAGLAVLARAEARLQRAAAFGAPLVVAVALTLAYNHARCGTPWASGYEMTQDAKLGFCVPWWSGLPGQLVSAGKGVLLYSPFLLCALAGAPAFWRRHRTDALLLLALTLPQLGVYAMWNCWSGDWSWGPRFMVPLVPLWGLAALPALERRALVGVLVAVGMCVQVPGVALEPFTYIGVVKDLPIACGADKLVDTPAHLPYMIDGLLHNHWYPSFSPLVGHAWLLGRMAWGVRAGDHPWAWLGYRELAPAPVVPRADVWWDRAPLVALVCLLIAGLAAVMLARFAPPEPGEPRPASADAPDPAVELAPLPGTVWALGLAALGIATLPAAFARAAPLASAGLLANACGAGFTALLIGRAAQLLDPRADGRRVAVAAFCTTLLWPRARDLSPFVPVALATAVLVEAGLKRPRLRRAALLAVGLASIVQAALRGTGPAPFPEGLYALTLSTGKSLFLYAPVGLLALPRLAAGDGAARFLGAVALAACGVEALSGAWMRDPGWGPAGLAPALVALLVAAGPALGGRGRRLSAGVGLLLAASFTVTLSAVLVSPQEGVSVQASVRGLFPPGHSRFDPDGRYRLSGMVFVADLAPIPTQLWLARLALAGASPDLHPAPWTGVFWRGYRPSGRSAPALDLAWIAR